MTPEEIANTVSPAWVSQDGEVWKIVMKAIDYAIREERERCAKIAEAIQPRPIDGWRKGIAAAIRSTDTRG
jgi:hypothetical protein